jgi:organic hydroperoxide reductase OsmC/OhrA
MSPLESSGKPLFFKAAAEAERGRHPPAIPHGTALRTVARSLAVMQKEALVFSSATGSVWRLASDEGAYLNGDDVAPCPLAFMSAGMAASFMQHILALAERRAMGDLRGLRIVQDNYYTMEGSALRGTMTGGALPVDLRMEVEAGGEDTALQQLLRDAVAASPVRALMGSVLASRFTLTHNAREVRTRRVASMDRSPEPWPEGYFESARPAAGGWQESVLKNGMSPRTQEVTSSTGSSYAAEQSRRLHLRSICTLRPDGIKTIEQQLLNPHGTIFHLLSEEGPGGGGQGRAPDAMTYLSAGIAFCFLTQFGRYAKIVRKDLRKYGVVQDTQFSSGLDGTIPRAEAVATHVHLESGEDDEFAPTILDMAEQTCFLHALCRTPLDVHSFVHRGRPS